MLRKIRVVPLAAESLGVRSMCTYVETSDVRILLDAGVSLCPSRFGLPPHPMEFQTINRCRREITRAAENADVVTLSHYHFDHHTPSFEDWLVNWTEERETARQIYQEKTVLVKNPRENINFSQRRRGWMFKKTGGKYAKKLEVADGKTFAFGDTQMRFSEPVFHGPDDTALGWVLMATVEVEGEKFMFAPDVQGPISAKTLALILGEKPKMIMIGGPPLYLAGFKIGDEQIEAGLRNLRKIVESVPWVIVEHHILRDLNWQESTRSIVENAEEKKHTMITAAEFTGKENAFLEADRKRLFADFPPSKEFEKWMNKSLDARKRVKPPI
jgi:predicted metallo-beta-lactamase superfamily hydrolase